MANTKKYVSLDKLGLYDEKIKKVITDNDAAALKAAKEYADGLATNYDAAGTAATEAAKVQAELDKEVKRAKEEEARIEGLVNTAQGEVDALELVVDTKASQADLTALANKVGEVPADKTVMGIIGEIQDGNATDNEALQAQIDALSQNKADKTQVATDIATAVKAEEDARKLAVQAVQDEVDALEQTHATDKQALLEAIALKADQTALDAVSAVANAAATKEEFDAAVAALEAEDERIAGLVATEKERAEGVEAGLEDRIETMEAFWEAAKADGDEGNVIDTLKEIQEYIASDETGASEMLAAINKNKEDIAAHVATDHDFGAADEALEAKLNAEIVKKADKTTVEGIDGRLQTAEGKITTLEGDMTQAKADIDAVEAAVATKAEAQALADAVAALEGADAGLAERIGALEAKHGDGEGTVESLIATAKQEAIDAAVAADAVVLESAKADAANKDAVVLAEAQKGINAVQAALDQKAADLTALTGRVTTAEGEIDTLQTEMDAVEALAAANESAIKALQTASATHATKEEVTAVSDRVTTLETWHSNFVECSQEDINNLFQ